jgi:hypothetical protein
MNLVVHSFMYYYYFLSAVGMRPSWDIFLTIGQLVQMVGGVTITVMQAKCPQARPFRYYIGAIMYASYFALFAKLFYDKYMKGKSVRHHFLIFFNIF